MRMNRRLVGATMVAAPVALAVAAVAAGLSPRYPAWWEAAVRLAVLGGITLMIYAVNIRIVPVFARRPWCSEGLLLAQVVAGAAGAWLAFLGTGMRDAPLDRSGHLLALAGGVLFMVNIVLLFRQEPTLPPAPPARVREQQAVDRIATQFTRLSGLMLVVGLGIGVMLSWWRPASGRWGLVWAHTLLVGFFLTMAAGVCYHVLARWTERDWRSVPMIRAHYRLVILSLPLMLLALAIDAGRLFLIAGPIQAVALGLFLANTLPLVWYLRRPVRAGILLAATMLVLGVGLGIAFAVDAGLGPRLRQTHALAIVFGFGGLLISGFGYTFVPSFAGRTLRWPRLAPVQLIVLVVGVAGGIAATAWRMLGMGPDGPVMVAGVGVGLGMLLFALQAAGTFAGPTPERSVVSHPAVGGRVRPST